MTGIDQAIELVRARVAQPHIADARWEAELKALAPGDLRIGLLKQWLADAFRERYALRQAVAYLEEVAERGEVDLEVGT